MAFAHTVARLPVFYGWVIVGCMFLLLSSWFVTKRGIALGLALAGTSLGSAFLPQLSAWLIGQMHWRDAVQVLGCLPIVLIPVLYLLVRERPADLGVQPLGGEAAPRSAPAGSHDIDMSEVWAQIRTFNFVLLGVIAALIFYTANAFIQHTFLYLRDQGFEPGAAATGFTIIFISGLVGKIASGFLVEKWGVKPIWIGFQALMLAGALVMILQGAEGAWIGLSCIGFGWGGAYALTQLTISNTFPPHVLGRLMGLFVIVEAVGAGSGSWLTGVLFDTQGSYDLAFLLTVGFMVAAVVGTRFLRARPP